MTALLALALAPVLALASPAEEAFFQGSVEAALAHAAENKVQMVVLDFRKEGSTASRKMAETTWQDPAVLEWIGKNALGVHLEAETSREQIQRYYVVKFPTVVLVNAKGDEIDRFEDYLGPQHFLREVPKSYRARGLLARAHRELRDKPDDPRARLDYARALMKANRLKGALDHYLFAWDRTRGAAGFERERYYGILKDVMLIARSDKLAREELRKRRNTAHQMLTSPRGREHRIDYAREVAALSKFIDQSPYTLDVWHEMRAKEDTPQEILDTLFGLDVQLMLYMDKRYEELLEGVGDPLVLMDSMMLDLERQQELEQRAIFAQNEKRQPGPGLESRRNRAVAEAGRYVESLFAVGRDRDADSLIDLVLTFDDRPESFIAMISAAKRGKRPDRARQIADRGLEVLYDRPKDLAYLEEVIGRVLPEPDEKPKGDG